MYRPEDIDNLKKEKEIKETNAVNNLYEKYGSMILEDLENLFNIKIIHYNNEQMSMFLCTNKFPKTLDHSFLLAQKIKNEFFSRLKSNDWIVKKSSGFGTCSDGMLTGTIHIISKQDYNKIQEQLERTLKRRFIRILKGFVDNRIINSFLNLLGSTPRTNLLLHD